MSCRGTAAISTASTSTTHEARLSREVFGRFSLEQLRACRIAAERRGVVGRSKRSKPMRPSFIGGEWAPIRGTQLLETVT